MYSSEAVAAINSKDNRDPTKVAEQIYVAMANVEAKTQGIKLTPDRDPEGPGLG